MDFVPKYPLLCFINPKYLKALSLVQNTHALHIEEMRIQSSKKLPRPRIVNIHIQFCPNVYMHLHNAYSFKLKIGTHIFHMCVLRKLSKKWKRIYWIRNQWVFCAIVLFYRYFGQLHSKMRYFDYFLKLHHRIFENKI